MNGKFLKSKLFISVLLSLLGVGLVIFLLSGGNLDILRSVFFENHTNEELRNKLSELGMRGHVTVVILSMLQVVLTFLPAEPVQVLSGVAFGFPIGLLLCSIGVLLGNTLVYLVYRTYGDGMREYFVKNLKLDFDKLSKSKRAILLIFILYFLPAIPYGMICFLAASMGMKFPRYIIITTLGAIPSVCIGVGLGHIAISTSWIFSILIFAILISLIIVLMNKRDYIFEKVNEFAERGKGGKKTAVKEYPLWLLNIAYVVSVIIFTLKGVKRKYTSKLDKDIEGPALVLCNHGAFVDFAYAGPLIRRRCPNFVVARLYFYKSWLNKLIRSYGCFPKSMFAPDVECVKNCLRVLRRGGVLAMMPEARLSTAGKFEDIQPSMYEFIASCGVPVYTIKISGDYLASPKWGNGIRRGSYVEAELDILFTKEELKALSKEEIKHRVNERLYYDDFKWLEAHPNVRYRSKKLAEGLENILSKCPKCNHKYTITTKKCDIFCENCGKLASIDNRYAFVSGVPFKNFSEWYEWQCRELRAEIYENPDFELKSSVEFKLPSLDGKRMLRHAGDGVCTLNREGLTYIGTKDGADTELHFPIKDIYRLLFGAGENFEIYVGNEIHFFVPAEVRSAVDWYVASAILHDREVEEKTSSEATNG